MSFQLQAQHNAHKLFCLDVRRRKSNLYYCNVIFQYVLALTLLKMRHYSFGPTHERQNCSSCINTEATHTYTFAPGTCYRTWTCVCMSMWVRAFKELVYIHGSTARFNRTVHGCSDQWMCVCVIGCDCVYLWWSGRLCVRVCDCVFERANERF